MLWGGWGDISFGSSAVKIVETLQNKHKNIEDIEKPFHLQYLYLET